MKYENNKPIYKVFEGWLKDISQINKYEDLPRNTKIYIEAIEKFLEVPIDIISNGPGRDESIIKNKIL